MKNSRRINSPLEYMLNNNSPEELTLCISSLSEYGRISKVNFFMQ